MDGEEEPTWQEDQKVENSPSAAGANQRQVVPMSSCYMPTLILRRRCVIDRQGRYLTCS